MVFGLSERPKEPEEVFTPRSPEVNPTMYINRPELESSLLRAVRTGYNLVIYGDSGCGKSWLYKKVFADNRIYFRILDFSASEDADDVDLQILEMVAEFEEWTKTKKEDSVEGKLAPGGLGVAAVGKDHWEKNEKSALHRLFEQIRDNAGKKKAFLVLENLEHVLDKQEIVNKIQNMLLSLDDPTIGKFRVRLCLVGVPSEIKEVLTAGNKYQTISNRVSEILEVERLSKEGVQLLVTRGLEQQLDLTFESKSYCVGQISYISDRVPQYVHDICLHTAILAEDSALTINPDVVDNAFFNWIETNARQGYEFICECLEGKGPMSKALSRVVYSVALTDHRRFQARDIEEIVRETFPNSTRGRRVQVLRLLRVLSSGEKSLLKCDEAKQNFRLVTPKLRPILRASLKLDDKEKVLLKRL